MRPTLAPLASLLLVLGCNGNVEVSDTTTGGTGGGGAGGTGGEGAADTGGTGGTGGGGEPSDVTGTVVYTYFTETSKTDVPVSLAGLSVQALVQEGGEWKIYPGYGDADGSFTIPAVPAGMFLLNIAGTYVYTSAHQLDLGSEIAGRQGATYSGAGTQIAGNVQNLAPWKSTDQIEWLDLNAGGAAYGFAGASPTIGATALMGEPSSWFGSLVNASEGDTLYLEQLTSKQAAGTLYYTIDRFASFPGVQQTDGAVTTVDGTFADVTADQSITIDFRASEIAKLGELVNPTAYGYGAALDVATLPGAGAAGFIGVAADLLLAYPGENNADLGKIDYANPYPAAWGATVYAGETWSVDYLAPGASSETTRYGSVYVITTPEQASLGPIQPLVGPVLEPTVDGQSAFGPLDGISATPTLSWKPPSVGTPTGYRVLVYEIEAIGPSSQATYTALLATTSTTLPFPPNLLQKGHAYAFTITAVVSPIDAASAPFRNSPTSAGADVLTSLAVVP